MAILYFQYSTIQACSLLWVQSQFLNYLDNSSYWHGKRSNLPIVEMGTFDVLNTK